MSSTHTQSNASTTENIAEQSKLFAAHTSIVTWNINSIAVRAPQVLAWVQQHKPDILCLQELKTTDDKFPTAAFEQLGYRCAVHGQKTYNGVAIVSRHKLEDVSKQSFENQARQLCATVAGMRIFCLYVPNGQAPDTDKYRYKLRFMRDMLQQLQAQQASGQPIIVCGDFNVAPQAQDVAKPDKWAGTVLCAQEVRQALDDWQQLGLVDAVRHAHPDARLYSWWDYRAGGFRRGDGLRIDHILTTRCLLGRIKAAGVDVEARGAARPSDHAPVWLALADV